METLRVTLVNVLVVLVFTIHSMAVPVQFYTGPPRPLNFGDTSSVISQMIENILDVYLKAADLQQLCRSMSTIPPKLLTKHEQNITKTVPGSYVRMENRINNLTYMLMEDYAHLSQAVKVYQRMAYMRENCTHLKSECQKVSSLYSIIGALEKLLRYIENGVGRGRLDLFGDLPADMFNPTVTPITNNTCRKDESNQSKREIEEYKQMFTLVTYTLFLNDSYVQFQFQTGL